MLDQRAVFDQELAQDRAVATVFVLTVAADGEIGRLRKHGEELDRAPDVRRGHFGSVLPDEGCPLLRRLGLQPELHGFRTWRKVRKPDIIPVLRRKLGSRDATRGAAHRADSNSFSANTWCSQPNNAYAHLAGGQG
jgi:hypothetical protein